MPFNDGDALLSRGGVLLDRVVDEGFSCVSVSICDVGSYRKAWFIRDGVHPLDGVLGVALQQSGRDHGGGLTLLSMRWVLISISGARHHTEGRVFVHMKKIRDRRRAVERSRYDAQDDVDSQFLSSLDGAPERWELLA